jgi:hypothetical protein
MPREASSRQFGKSGRVKEGSIPGTGQAMKKEEAFKGMLPQVTAGTLVTGGDVAGRAVGNGKKQSCIRFLDEGWEMVTVSVIGSEGKHPYGCINPCMHVYYTIYIIATKGSNLPISITIEKGSFIPIRRADLHATTT